MADEYVGHADEFHRQMLDAVDELESRHRASVSLEQSINGNKAVATAALLDVVP
jgi:hypothetical protein